ncbi:SixA phosphatase family protein [Nocardioides psychrotolerans]|nr:histidine phosphatase family protein [Nocardioides psychrotolerans]
MPGSPRTLVVMRHAKAEQAGPTDFERELAERGRQDGAAAGGWLAARGILPDVALVSAATRARQTFTSVAQGAQWTLEPTLDRGLYAADPDTALDLVRSLGDDVSTVVVIGHNPTMAYLATILDDGEGDAAVGMTGAFPTSAVAVFTYDGTWGDLAGGGARVTAYHVGRA